MQRRAPVIGRFLFACLVLTMAPAYATTCDVSVLPLNFGAYDPHAVVALDIATTATVTCTATSNRPQGETVTVTSSISIGGAPSFTPRQMRNVLNESLDYNIYVNPVRTVIFGDGTAGTGTTARTATVTRTNSAAFIVNVYGRIFPGQDVRVGAYSDALVYTIDF